MSKITYKPWRKYEYDDRYPKLSSLTREPISTKHFYSRLVTQLGGIPHSFYQIVNELEMMQLRLEGKDEGPLDVEKEEQAQLH